MATITRNDPRRRALHDFWLVDPLSGRDLAGFATQAEAEVYAIRHLRGRITILEIRHPDGCGCRPGQGCYPDGRLTDGTEVA